jgi:predicted acylesterase/phospholipase RssA
VRSLLVVLILVLCSRGALAEERRSRVPIAITISGGGSRGAYMAGQLFYLDHVRRLAGERFELRVFTGASAGSINSLVAALTSCNGKPAADPRKSLFYASWVPAGMNEAFDPDRTTATGILSRDGFREAINRLRRIWKAGLPTSCDVVIGIAITRMSPQRVALAKGFPSLPRSLETVLVRITGRGVGKAPRVRNYVDPAKPTPQVLLPLDGPDAKPFEALKELVFASSAFPVAFAPVHLQHCMSEPGESTRCTRNTATRSWFIDGGVFDNQPLGLAVRAMRGVRVEEGRIRIADTPTGRPDRSARFVYVDPRVSDLPTIPPERRAPPDTALGVLASMLTMIESARSAELIRVFERFPQVQNRLLLTRTHLMPISSTFSGFLERAFREFDFYLGMYDAARSMRKGAWGGLAIPASAIPEKVLSKDPKIRRAWRPFFCLRHLIDGVGTPKDCAGESMRDFRILAQVTFDRVYDHCRAMREASPKARADNHRFCHRAINGWLAERVPGLRDQPDAKRRRRPDESEIMYLFRLLGHYGFHFRDLGLERDEATLAPRALIRLAQRMTRALADAQPSMSLPYGVMGRLGVDTGLGYLPPQHIFHLSVGLGFEFGYSYTFDDWRFDWVRFTAALELDGLSSVFNSNDDYLAVIPKVGPEIEVYGSSVAQIRVGARVGYQLSTGDSWRTDPCNHDDEDVVPCSRFATEAYVSSSLVGLIRLHVAGSWLPPVGDHDKSAFAVRPMIGLQLSSPF